MTGRLSVAQPHRFTYGCDMGLGRGKTEHDGPRDMSRKHGHWGFTEEAKKWASRARRRDERAEIANESVPQDEDDS